MRDYVYIESRKSDQRKAFKQPDPEGKGKGRKEGRQNDNARRKLGEGRKGAKWSGSYGFFRSRCGKMGKEESEIMGEKVNIPHINIVFKG